MKNKIKITITCVSIATLFIIFFFSLNTNKYYDTKHIIGDKIEPFKIESLIGEEIISIKNFKDTEYVLINFWASWCAPCLIEHPILMKLSKNKNLKIFGINFKDKKNNAQLFLRKNGNPFSFIGADNNGTKSVMFGIYGIPESILVNKDYKIINKFIGPLNEKDYEKLTHILKQ